MKRIIAIIVSAVLLAGVGVAGYFVFNRLKKDKTYNLTLTAENGGAISVKFDNKSYIVTGETETYTVKYETEVILTAVPEVTYTLKNWVVNNTVYEDLTKTIVVTEHTTVKAEFKVRTLNLAVSYNDNPTDVENVDYQINTNLLSFLQNRYPATTGYTYSYKCNGVAVNADTVISEDAQITIEKTPNVYSVTFKLPNGYTFDGTNSTRVVEYTIENVTSLTAPALPNAREHYTLNWEAYDISASTLGVVTEVNAVESPIKYVAKLVLPEGCTFLDGSRTKDIIYTVGATVITIPEVNAVAEHYELKWPTYTLDYSDNLVIEATLEKIVYSVTFKNDDTVIETKEYVYGDTVQAPEVPAFENSQHYTCGWPVFELDYTKTQDVKLNKVAKEYTVTFMDGDTQVGEVLKYTIDNKSITIPDAPEYDNYNTSWEAFDLNSLTNLTVNLVKTAKTYTVTFKNGTEIVAETNYTIENQTITAPTVPSVLGYTTKWPEIVIPANYGDFEVLLGKEIITYTVTFKNGETEVGSDTYTVEDQTITTPTAPVVSGKISLWPEVVIPSELGDFEVQLTTLDIVQINYEFEDDIYDTSDLNSQIRKVAYVNDTIYVGTNNSATTMTFDSFANTIFNNFKYGNVATINEISVDGIEAFKTQLQTALSNGTTITILYAEA